MPPKKTIKIKIVKPKKKRVGRPCASKSDAEKKFAKKIAKLTKEASFLKMKMRNDAVKKKAMARSKARVSAKKAKTARSIKLQQDIKNKKQWMKIKSMANKRVAADKTARAVKLQQDLKLQKSLMKVEAIQKRGIARRKATASRKKTERAKTLAQALRSQKNRNVVRSQVRRLNIAQQELQQQAMDRHNAIVNSIYPF